MSVWRIEIQTLFIMHGSGNHFVGFDTIKLRKLSMENKTYVIGHVNPDTDSIASAMGYAWLLRERDNLDVIAARAGALNPQTAWVLKKLNLEPPFLLSDASPRFQSVTQRLDSIRPEAQLGAAWTL